MLEVHLQIQSKIDSESIHYLIAFRITVST
jgi:hypothetical protein